MANSTQHAPYGEWTRKNLKMWDSKCNIRARQRRRARQKVPQRVRVDFTIVNILPIIGRLMLGSGELRRGGLENIIR